MAKHLSQTVGAVHVGVDGHDPVDMGGQKGAHHVAAQRLARLEHRVLAHIAKIGSDQHDAACARPAVGVHGQ